jgi:aerobic carbon-monoxide dehydrogenase large subunit
MSGSANARSHDPAQETGPYIGRSILRREDGALVTGRGSYVADLQPAGLAHLAVFRTYVPVGRVAEVDLSEARLQPGVLAAWTAADLGLARPDLPHLAAPRDLVRQRPVLAEDRVRYSGDALAVLVADTLEAACDALPFVRAEVVAEPAGQDHAGNVNHSFGNVAAAFAAAPVVVGSTLRMGRICGAAIEPRAALGAYDPDLDTYTISCTTSWTFGVRDALAAVLGVPAAQVVVLAPDVGGSFGAKNMVYPEYALVAIASRLLGRPVRWVATRSEDGQSTGQAHGCELSLEIAAEADGRLRGIRGRAVQDLGAYVSAGINQSDNFASHQIAAYRLPALSLDIEQVYTPSPPSIHIRGGGRPVGNFAIERMIDRLARRLRLDPVEVRRRNLVQPEQMPYDTGYPSIGGGTVVYDGGDYPRLLDLALRRVGSDRVRSRQRAGEPIGLGVALCVESTGIGAAETARVLVAGDGRVEVLVGSSTQGQGHATMLAQVAADRLGWDYSLIRVRGGDSRLVPYSVVTAGSRTAVEVGNAVALAAGATRRLLLARASEALEADTGDITLGPQGAWVRGFPARVLAVADLVGDGLEVSETFDPARTKAYASSCHAAVVRVDIETCELEVLRYVQAHDSGRAINPLTLEGQLQGGFAHGLGYALYEEARYQPDGTFLTPSFLDYTIPSAPELRTEPELLHIETFSGQNPEGIRGAGEAGTIAVPAAIANAVEDALWSLGLEVEVNEIPITPQRLFDLIHPKLSPAAQQHIEEGVV